jgi:hypothetical protein
LGDGHSKSAHVDGGKGMKTIRHDVEIFS